MTPRDSESVLDREARRLLYTARFKLSECIGFINTVRPGNDFVRELEWLCDEISMHLTFLSEQKEETT